MDKILLNVNNMTKLWTLGGQIGGHFYTNDDYSVSITPGSDWPNKLWFHHTPNTKILDSILEKWDMSNITIPVWGSDSALTEGILLRHGFTMKSELTGMSIPLNSEFNFSNRLNMVRVGNPELAAEWASLFSQCFGYHINQETIEKTMDRIDYFIGKIESQSIGTGVLYKDSKGVVGLHSLGILPALRRQGFAEEFLIFLLQTAKSLGAGIATLQASKMGEGLYHKTGFTTDFQLKNFTNTQK